VATPDMLRCCDVFPACGTKSPEVADPSRCFVIDEVALAACNVPATVADPGLATWVTGAPVGPGPSSDARPRFSFDVPRATRVEEAASTAGADAGTGVVDSEMVSARV
jgi:hypothetical protein